MLVTSRDFANIVKLPQNNIQLKNIVFFVLGFIIIRKQNEKRAGDETYFHIRSLQYINPTKKQLTDIDNLNKTYNHLLAIHVYTVLCLLILFTRSMSSVGVNITILPCTLSRNSCREKRTKLS